MTRGRPHELVELESLLHRLEREDFVRIELLETIDGALPIHGVVVGSEDPCAPCFCVVGGVHGIERIGTRVVLAYLHTVVELLRWDSMLPAMLERCRIAFLPIVNPGGLLRRTRANPRGVDLMRNAPHPASEEPATFMVGGQSISPRLPWFRGDEHQLEPEARALCDFVERHCFRSEFALALDCHSGFGMVDRLWFPWAGRAEPYEHIGDLAALGELLDQTLPNHVYRMEPQASAYRIAGDLWDHMLRLHEAQRPLDARRRFLPLTLEMGSWLWVRKNPRQALTLLGGFNPIKPHRLRRTLRRHLPLFDFLHRAVIGHERWRPQAEDEIERARRRALNRWYR